MNLPRIGTAAMIAAFLCGCTSPPPEPKTVDGPETPGLKSSIEGTLVWVAPRGGIEAIALPSEKKTIVRAAAPLTASAFDDAHAISGPDDLGRVAYIWDRSLSPNDEDQRHRLKVIEPAGGEELTLFTRRGSARWATSLAGSGEIGSYLSLSPTGGKIALLSQLVAVEMPGPPLHAGQLEIWQIASRQGRHTLIAALDEPAAWFPDASRLACTRLVARAELPTAAAGLDAFDKQAGEKWERVPAIYLVEAITAKSEFFCVGRFPVISHDGRAIFVRDGDKDNPAWRAVDMETKRETPLAIPGMYHLIAAPAAQRVLGWSYPTAGAPPQYSEKGSPLGGIKQLVAIKAADPETGAFETIVPAIDPRTKLSFGRPLPNR